MKLVEKLYEAWWMQTRERGEAPLASHAFAAGFRAAKLLAIAEVEAPVTPKISLLGRVMYLGEEES